MRRHHWSAAVLATLAMLASSRGVLAQFDDDYGTESSRIRLAAEAQPRDVVPYNADWPAGEPGPTGNPYVPFNQFGPNPGSYPPPAFNSPVGMDGIPPTARPWPGISPFTEHQFNTTTNESGLWWNRFRDLPGDGHDYYFSGGYLLTRTRRPDARPVGSDERPVPPTSLVAPQFFQPVKLSSIFPYDTKTNGMEFTWGYKKADDSGLEIKAIWITEGTARYSRGFGISDPENPQSALNYRYLRNTNGIPLISGPTSGSTVPYDTQFLLTHSSEMYGASLDFINTPWRSTSWYMIRPTWGARYMLLKEKFNFFGQDSNLDYLLSPSGFVVPGTISSNPNGFPAYTTYFESRVDSHLFGPEIGLKYEMGGKALKLLGETKFSLMGNIERLNFSGRNLGDGGLTNFDLVDTSFQQRITNSHVSPAFDQSFKVEAPVFGLIPYVNRLHFMEDAVLRLGWNYLRVSEVSRPESNIVYRGWPQLPELKTSHQTWHMSNFSFEIDWRY